MNKTLLTPADLAQWQRCPAKWSLQGQPVYPPVYSEYIEALRKTIFQLYARRLAGKGHHYVKHTSAKELWDKNWWARQNKGSADHSELYQSAADGWLLLEKFWGEVYLKEEALPLAINFEFSLDIGGLQYRIHEDLTLATEDGRIIIIELGGLQKEWDYYNSLGTKLEIYALEKSVEKTPTQKIYIDLASKKREFMRKELNIDSEYAKHCGKIVTAVSKAIAAGAVYASPSENCVSCPVRSDCWI